MQIIIIGAGIAGLSAGIALRRGGHKVIILEQSSLSHEVGAAISIGPNASPVLRGWGFDIAKAQMVAVKHARIVDGMTMQTTVPDYQANIERDYGAPVYAVHRVDLHDQLRDLATSTDGPGVPCEVHVRSKVVHYDTTSAIATLADGASMQGDLIIAADGVHSIAKDYILEPEEQVAQHTGWASMRWLLPTKELMADPAVAALVEESTIRFLRGKAGGNIIWYQCRNNTVQNFMYASQSFAPAATTEDFHAGVDASMISEYAQKDFGPELQAVLAKAHDVKFWKLIARDPIPRWHKDKLVLIGDAAHPMLPFQAQGGGQAIEDAAALGLLLKGVDGQNLIPERLQLFEKIRRDRASALQLLSSNTPPPVDSVIKLAAKYLPDGVDARNHVDVTKYIFSFDVLQTTRDELERSQR